MKEKYFQELVNIQKEFLELNRQADALPVEFYRQYWKVLEYYRKRYEKLLARAVEVEEYITEELIKIRSKILLEQQKWNKVAIVCLTWDLAHPGHINYIKTIREKIKRKFWLNNGQLKLFVGLETAERTKKRKWKEPILSDEERKYQWQHIKGVDETFIWNISEDLYPSDLMLFLQPDFWVSHQEYFDRFWKYLRVSRKLKHWTFWKTKVVIVWYNDPDKYLLEWNVRRKWNLSSTELVKRVLEKQGELIVKKFPEKVIEMLAKIDFKSLSKR